MIDFSLLTRNQLQQVHDASLAVLSRTGMRIESKTLLSGLKKTGAKVDEGASVVRIPEQIVEKTILNIRSLISGGKTQHLLNGVTSELSDGSAISAKISGGCERYLDWEHHATREADHDSLLNFIRLGELLPEVGFVGNPVVLRTDSRGEQIDERFRRIRTAALVAKNTRKVGSMEVWDEREIEYLEELGVVARGGREAFRENPCFVTAKETISPLFLDEKSGDILLAFAKRDLPCTVIPMPISGLSAPVSVLGNAVVGNAEILGTMTAIQSTVPEAVVGGGTISGVLDMQSGCVSFSAPEAILQDLAIAEVHRELYGFNYLIGSGYTDAKYPSKQVLEEKTFKLLLTFLSGRYTYPLGLINGGSVFSAEQALVDLEVCKNIHAQFDEVGESSDMDEIVELIHTTGIRGNYIDSEHTLAHFRDFWLPDILDRSAYRSLGESADSDVYRNAHAKIEKLENIGEFWEIDAESSREIDRIVLSAERALQKKETGL